MRIIIIIILLIAAIITCISCNSKQFQEVTIKELQTREIEKQHEIKYGLRVIDIIHNTHEYKTLNDSVALRIVDNAYFVKRRDKTLGDWRYYRIE